MTPAMRAGIWTLAALFAVTLAVVAARTDAGARRLTTAYKSLTGSAEIAVQAPDPLRLQATELENQARRLSDSLRSLSTDRDRLLARVTVLERNYEDVTGSIARTPAKSEAPADIRRDGPPETVPVAPPPPPQALTTLQSLPSTLPYWATPVVPLPLGGGERIIETPTATSPDTKSDGTVTRTDFGVDIGHGPSVAALRAAWNSARRNHPGLFAGLRPLIAVRDGGKPGALELRLVIGPLANASAAARLCASLAGTGLSCQPAIFDGQALALR